jgi:O-antigen ligase
MTMDGLQEAHNGYVEVYLNLGWVGIILLAGIIVTGYRNAIISFQRNPNIGSLRLAMFLIALVYNLAEAGFRETMLIWIFFLMASSAVPDFLLQPATKTEVEPEFVPLRPSLNPRRSHALNFRATDRSKI